MMRAVQSSPNHRPVEVWICADGGPTMGYGHWVRAARLGKKISSWARVSYVEAERTHDSSIPEGITDAGPVMDQGKATQMLSWVSPQFLITDMPRISHETARLIKRCRDVGALVVSIHDLGLGQFDSHLAIDPSAITLNPIQESRYPFGVLLGPQYTVLSDRFQQLHHVHRMYPAKARSLLVTLGGGATWHLLDNLAPVLERLSKSLRIKILSGFAPENPSRMLRQLPNGVTCLDVPVGADLADSLTAADMVVVAGGITLYEAACAGSPALVLSHHAFQKATGAAFEELGIAVNLGVASEVSPRLLESAALELGADPERRKSMGMSGKRLIDGCGAQRIDVALHRLVIGMRTPTVHRRWTTYDQSLSI